MTNMPTPREELEDFYSGAWKDAYGVRPNMTVVRKWTDTELEQAIDDLMSQFKTGDL
jgi:hypothetical protein